MEQAESYSRGQKIAAWLGVAAAAGLLAICLDVALGGALSRRGTARYRWAQATSSEDNADD
jgi:hypothetical protein